MPITIKLLLYQLYYSLLLRLYPCLFLPEPIQLCLSLCDLLPMHVEVIQSCVRILIPNIKKSNDYISSKVAKSLDIVGRQLPLIILILLIVKIVRCELENITKLRLFFGFQHSVVTFLIECFLDVLIDLFILLVQSIPDQVSNACVLLWLKLIIESVHMISAFQCIRMHDTKLLVKHYSSASLFGLIFVTILCLHVFARKDTLLELEVNAIFTQHLREDLALHLLDKLVYCVSEGEISLEGRMSMQIKVHEESLVYGKMFAQFFYGKARRLLLYVRIRVISIKVLVENVHPAMSSCDSIWIKHRNKHKNKIFSQQVSPHIFLIQQKLNDAVHAVTRWRFYGMYSCRDEYNRFIASKFNDSLVLERHAFDRFIPFLAFMRRDDNTVYYPSLVRLCQLILLKEQLLIVLILHLQLHNILPAIFIRIGINERKLDTLNILCKEIIELQGHSLIGNAEIKNRMGQSQPFCSFLMVIPDSVNRSIQL